MDQKTLQAVYDDITLFRNALADIEYTAQEIMKDGTSTGKKTFYVGVDAEGRAIGTRAFGAAWAEMRQETGAMQQYAGEDPISGKILEKTYQHLMNLLRDPDGEAAKVSETRKQIVHDWMKKALSAAHAFDNNHIQSICITSLELEELQPSEAAEDLNQKFILEKGLSIQDVIFGVEDGPRGISQMFDTILNYLQWHQEQIKKPQEATEALKPKNRW